MAHWSDIAARVERLRVALDAGDAAPPERAREIRVRLDDARRMFDALAPEQSPAAAHPLGADPPAAAWILFQLDRCEALLEAPPSRPARAALAGVLRTTPSDALFRRGLATILAVRGYWKGRRPEAASPPAPHISPRKRMEAA